MSTVYPNGIDNTITLPMAIDGQTLVNALVVNQLRDAIIAIENELGVDPSREYGTVRARLDALEAGGGGGGGGSIISVEKNGTTQVPILRFLNFTGSNVTVTDTGAGRADIAISSLTAPLVGQNGYVPIANAGDVSYLAGTVSGQVLTWNGTSWGAASVGPGTLFTEVQGTVTTLNATPVTLITYPVSVDGTYNVAVNIAAKNNINGNGNIYTIVGGFKRVAGVLTQLGSTSQLISEEDDLTLNADFLISGSNLIITVTGNASLSVSWKGIAQIVSV